MDGSDHSSSSLLPKKFHIYFVDQGLRFIISLTSIWGDAIYVSC